MGVAGAVTGLHNDDENNMMLVLRGRKRVTLLPPHERDLVYVLCDVLRNPCIRRSSHHHTTLESNVVDALHIWRVTQQFGLASLCDVSWCHCQIREHKI